HTRFSRDWSSDVCSTDLATTFPGASALVPPLDAAAVLLAGSGDGRGELRPLTAAPMQHVGAWSYSLYLWHWPLIVVATAVWGTRSEERRVGTGCRLEGAV